jgi:hypothetical protein
MHRNAAPAARLRSSIFKRSCGHARMTLEQEPLPSSCWAHLTAGATRPLLTMPASLPLYNKSPNHISKGVGSPWLLSLLVAEFRSAKLPASTLTYCSTWIVGAHVQYNKLVQYFHLQKQQNCMFSCRT